MKSPISVTLGLLSLPIKSFTPKAWEGWQVATAISKRNVLERKDHC